MGGGSFPLGLKSMVIYVIRTRVIYKMALHQGDCRWGCLGMGLGPDMGVDLANVQPNH